MITLTGKLRQSGPVTYEGVTKLKLWIEHETPRENGVPDLKLEELFLEGIDQSALPPAGSEIAVQVRPYAMGKAVKYSAVALAASVQPSKKSA